MASIILDNVGVEFPIYSARGRSIRSDVIKRVGGRIHRDDSDSVTIRALENVNLEIHPGDRLALVGHNGAGKSTLLRVLCGAYEPSSGLIAVNGHVASLIDLMMGMDVELTGRENIVLRGVHLGLTFSQIRALTPSIEEFAELGDFINLPLRTYSSGMTLRLAFAISTAVQPDILLMDEMISVGDAGFAERAHGRLEQLMENSRILVLASHKSGLLKRYCNRAILLRGGQIQADGSVEEILEQHARKSD